MLSIILSTPSGSFKADRLYLFSGTLTKITVRSVEYLGSIKKYFDKYNKKFLANNVYNFLSKIYFFLYFSVDP